MTKLNELSLLKEIKDELSTIRKRLDAIEIIQSGIVDHFRQSTRPPFNYGIPSPYAALSGEEAEAIVQQIVKNTFPPADTPEETK